jgi:PKD repeat protein
MRVHLLRGLAIAALMLGVLLVPATANAATPANDDFANAQVITSLPFSDSVAIDDATLEGGEPSGCYFAGKSVWYSITPSSNGVLRADISTSSFFDRILYVYRQDGSGFGGLSTIACASPYYNGQSSATFSVEAGKTYYLQVGSFYSFSTGTLNLSVEAIPPPPNDDFANATSIGALPFSGTEDLSAAAVEPGEPGPGCFGTNNTVWFSFTAGTTQSLTATIDQYGAGIASYTGNSLSGLSQVGCTSSSPLTFRAQAGTTYFFQVGAWCCSGFGPVTFRLAVAPNPVAQFSFYPGDPNSFDTIQFYDNSYDPAGAGISSEAWDFGDGATASGCCPTHRYAGDGTYTVQLIVTTSDGRTANAKHDVQVKTHDVTIAKVLVPQTARVGQTRPITVGLTNSRYPETVQVQLLKSVAGGGWQQVGVLAQYVPVRGANRTIDFNFNYTFAPEDAVLGRVTFQAIATIQGARDAIPTDNTFISLPTKVTP